MEGCLALPGSNMTVKQIRTKKWRCTDFCLLGETWEATSCDGRREVHRGLLQMRSLPLVVSLLLTEGVSPGRALGEGRAHWLVSQEM